MNFSSIQTSPPRPKAYNPLISMNSLIIWLFYIDQYISLTQMQMSKIQQLYGTSEDALNANIQKGHLPRVLRAIQEKKQNRSIKLCIHSQYLDPRKIKLIQKYQIIDLCIFCDDLNQVKEIDSRLSQEFKKSRNIYYSNNIRQIIKVAIKEVEDFTKSYRTFYNSVCLVKQNTQFINRYRFRLISSINIKKSDEENMMNKFWEFSSSRHSEMLKILKNQNFTQNNIKNQRVFDEYRQNIKQYKEKIKECQKQISQAGKLYLVTQANLIFWNKMISIYQQQSFFYHILNRYLRIMKEQSIQDWTVLAHPFSYMYQSIKNLYKHHRSKDPFYTKKTNNYVYRGGRIKDCEIKEMTQAALNIISQRTKMEAVEIERAQAILKGCLKEGQKYKNLFIEFFGFVSTTTDLNKAVNSFLNNNNQKDEGYDSQSDYGCIFQIQIKENEIVHEQKYDHLLHGFYKLTKDQKRGEIEKQVLFNALNIFKLKSIKPKMLVDGVDGKELKNYDSNAQLPLVYFLELEYGSFFDLVFDRDIDALTPYQQTIKKSYCYCYNKIRNTDKFDIGDAYEFTGDFNKSQQYFQSKVRGTDSNQQNQSKDKSKFQISKLDNKNYFLRLSQVYDNLGQAKKAEEYARLSIECFKFLQNLEQNKIYIKHMERLFAMQEKIIEYLERTSCTLRIEEEIQIQKKFIDDLERQRHPSVPLRKSELLLKIGVLEFEKGELQSSYQNFSNCQNNVANTFKKLKQIQNDCYLEQYLKNLICRSEYSKDKVFINYCSFANHVKQLIKGGEDNQKQAFEKILSKSIALSEDASEAIKERVKSLKDKDQLKNILAKFNRQISKNSKKSGIEKSIENIENEINSKTDSQLLSLIQMEIGRLKQVHKESKQYDKGIDKMKEWIARYRKIKILTIDYDQFKDSNQTDFIQKFLKKERQNRLDLLEKRRKINIQETCNFFNKQLDKIMKEIQQSIDELKQNNVSEYNYRMTEKRSQLAQIALNNNNYQLALQQIQSVIRHNNIEGEVKELQIAKALKLKGKISMKYQKYKQAINELNQSLDYHIKQFSKDLKDNYNENNISKDNFIKIENVWVKTEFFETILLKCKASLYRIYQIQNFFEKRNKCINSEEGPNKKQALELLMNVQSILRQLFTVFRIRKDRFQVSQLQIEYPQIRGLFNLIKKQSRQAFEQAFKFFEESINLRNQLYYHNNTGNLIMCSEIVYGFSDNPEIYDLLLIHGYFDRISEYYSKIKGKSNFKWKLEKALFYRQKYRPNKESNQKQQKYLRQTISTLTSLQDPCLSKETYELQTYYVQNFDRKYQIKTRLNEKFQLQYKSYLIKPLNSKITVPNTAFSGHVFHRSLLPPILQSQKHRQQKMKQKNIKKQFLQTFQNEKTTQQLMNSYNEFSGKISLSQSIDYNPNIQY